MNKDLPELIQKNASIDGEDDEDPMPTTFNLDTLEMAPTGMGSMGIPSFWLKGMPEDDESSVKDSVTSETPNCK